MEDITRVLTSFSKFFSDRYGISEKEYTEGTLLGSEESYREFYKICGHWMEENSVNKLHLNFHVDVDEDALVAYYDPGTKKVIYKDGKGDNIIKLNDKNGKSFFINPLNDKNDVVVRCPCDDFKWLFNYSDQLLKNP
jgi:hypothetical protein